VKPTVGGAKAPAATSSAAVMVVFGKLNFARSPQEPPLASDLPCGASDDAGGCVDDGDWRLQAESASAVTHMKLRMQRVMFCFMVQATSNRRAPNTSGR